jgi:nicotinate-nucleotide pyrophosphorylase (carboxylating)
MTATAPMRDPRDDLFAGVRGRTVTAAVIADDPGLVIRLDAAAACARELGLEVSGADSDVACVLPGTELLRVHGTAKQVALAEERLVGMLAKPSGIATATRRFVERASGRMRIVSGAWKKLPFSQKEMIRSAVVAGGGEPRIMAWPFVYLDKNAVRMLGGTAPAVRAAVALDHGPVVAQLGGTGDPSEEACTAARLGAHVVFVDTGRLADVAAAAEALRARGLRDRVQLAFAGGVGLDDVTALAALGVDAVDIGRAIVDAPLLDMHVRVLGVAS